MAEPGPAEVDLPTGRDWFSDANGGFWAAATTFFCLAVGVGGHLLLLAAHMGRTTGDPAAVLDWGLVALIGVLCPAIAVGGIAVAVTRRGGRQTRAFLVASSSAFLGLATLAIVAWLASNGRAIVWQPIVGASLSAVAIASFGGYFLASRRARVGLAASFVTTFLLLFSFVLTLDSLSAVFATAAAGEEAENAANAAQLLLTDVRGNVALIMGFYFGSDAAINVVKILKTRANDRDSIESLARMDRDLAVPRRTDGA